MTEALLWLRGSPLTGILLTLLCYQLALKICRRYHGHPLANTVLLASCMLISVLLLLDMNFEQYFRGASYLQFLLGPVTVALAIPLYNNLARLRSHGLPVLLTILFGSLAGVALAVLCAQLAGFDRALLLSLAPRSATTPIAMGVAEQIGGIPALAAAFVIVTGIIGAVAVKPLFDLLRIRNEMVLGVATGIAAHGIGTARIFQISESAGAFAGLAMGFTGLFTALLAPLVVGWLL